MNNDNRYAIELYKEIGLFVAILIIIVLLLKSCEEPSEESVNEYILNHETDNYVYLDQYIKYDEIMDYLLEYNLVEDMFNKIWNYYEDTDVSLLRDYVYNYAEKYMN